MKQERVNEVHKVSTVHCLFLNTVFEIHFHKKCLASPWKLINEKSQSNTTHNIHLRGTNDYSMYRVDLTDFHWQFQFYKHRSSLFNLQYIW